MCIINGVNDASFRKFFVREANEPFTEWPQSASSYPLERNAQILVVFAFSGGLDAGPMLTVVVCTALPSPPSRLVIVYSASDLYSHQPSDFSPKAHGRLAWSVSEVLLNIYNRWTSDGRITLLPHQLLYVQCSGMEIPQPTPRWDISNFGYRTAVGLSIPEVTPGMHTQRSTWRTHWAWVSV